MEESVGAALVELARYHRGEIESLDGLPTNLGDLDGAALTKAWTKAQLGFSTSGYQKQGYEPDANVPQASVYLPIWLEWMPTATLSST